MLIKNMTDNCVVNNIIPNVKKYYSLTYNDLFDSDPVISGIYKQSIKILDRISAAPKDYIVLRDNFNNYRKKLDLVERKAVKDRFRDAITSTERLRMA
jgi:hypothetical protein